jgi:ribosomal protein S13
MKTSWKRLRDKQVLDVSEELQAAQPAEQRLRKRVRRRLEREAGAKSHRALYIY